MKSTVLRALTLICLTLLLTRVVSPVRADSPADPTEKLAPQVREALAASAPNEMIGVIVTMRDQADLGQVGRLGRAQRLQRVVELLQARAEATQRPLRAWLERKRLEGAVGEVVPYWIFNGLAISANADVIHQLTRRTDVVRITPNETIEAPAPTASVHTAEANLSIVNAPALWELGYRGQGIVIASMDTGVYLNHPDLYARWRGGSNSWFDPYNQHPASPVDMNGHGTQTMGVMVGGDAGGTAIGVAPDAQWIAVKIFDDRGRASISGIHSGYQWLLDPDGNPSTPDAPHVVNNSWGFSSWGCNLEFQYDLQALRAAGILPVFSAGNTGPYSATSTSPANNPAAFAVGAVDDAENIYYFSARGPSSCGEASTIFPELVAPGVGIRTSNRYGSYNDATGTSLAAPHVSGALALLLCAYPDLSVSEQEQALLDGAVDLGAAGPDNTFGYGRLDILASYQALSSGLPTETPAPPTKTPVPSATPTPTWTPAATATATPEPATPTVTFTATPEPATPTATFSPTPEPATATPTFTPTPESPTPTPDLPTATWTPLPTATATLAPTAPPGSGANLALGRPVTVSSYQDDAHNGNKAVDGQADTYWQSRRATWRNSLPSEWITVDLGSQMAIGQVVLAWDTYYATHYTVQVSNDGNDWTTVFSTTTGSGGTDTLSFAPATARYVRMDSTAWSNFLLRNWLKEIEVYE